MPKICHNCVSQPTKSNKFVKAQQKHEFRVEFPESTHLFAPKNANVKVKVSGLKPNTRIFYFATHECDVVKDTEVLDRDTSYGGLENSGVTTVNANGEAIVKLQCPRVYYVPTTKRAYPRHFHFTYHSKTSKDSKPWSTKLNTHTVFCTVTAADVAKVLNNKSAIVADALPTEYYDKKHIKGAINIPHDELKQFTAAKVKGMMQKANAKLFASISNWKHIPMVLYCYSKTCDAAEHLKEHLEKLGVVNTWHYEEGISEWKNKKYTAS